MTIVEDFDDGVLDSRLLLVPEASNSPDGSHAFQSGKLVFSTTAFLGSYRANLYLQPLVVGDFEATVEVSNSSGRVRDSLYAQEGIDPSPQWSAETLLNTETSGSDFWIAFAGAPGGPVNTGPAASNDAVFRIRRVGTSLSADIDFGSGFQTLATTTDPQTAGDGWIVASIRLLGPSTATFDNFTITADAFTAVPEPGSLLLLGIGSLLLAPFIARRC